MALFSLLYLLAPNHPIRSQEPKTYRVGVFNFYPAVYADKNGEIGGFYTDMLREIAINEGIRFEYVYGSWDEGLQRLKDGEVDLLTSVAKTPDREAYMTYGEVPLLTVWGELCVPQASIAGDHSDLRKISGLRGKTIAVMVNDFNAASFKSYIDRFGIQCSYLEVPDFRAVLAAVRDGKADAGVISALVGEALQDDYGLVSSGIAFNPFDIYFTVKKGENPELIGLLDDYLTRWKRNPASVYFSARLKWGHDERDSFMPVWVLNLLLALAAILVFSLSFTVLLRLRVTAVTKELAESKNTLKLILDSTAEGIYGVDSAGNCVFCNASALNLLGYSAEGELLGANMHCAVHRPPTAPGECSDVCDLDGQGNRKVHDRERVFYRRDGSELPVEVWAWPMTAGDGRSGAVVTFYDNTERKNAEADRIARAAAERANKAKSAFLANMSHELRTPLNSVIVLSNVLGRRLEGAIPAEEHSYLGVIERNGKRLLGLINEVLDLTRIEAGREKVTPVEFTLDGLLKEIGETIEPQAREKGLRLSIIADGNQPKMKTDRAKCMHVLLNLAGNAVKFTDMGTVTIMAECAGESVTVSVSDTGIGISEDFLPRVFEEFSQGDESASRSQKGTGLGLAIAKRYALLLGGDITVTSRLGEGSEFSFTIPALYREANPQDTFRDHSAGESTAGHGGNNAAAYCPAASDGTDKPLILVVEDNADNRLTVRSLLASSCRLIEAENGQEGVEMARRYRPDLVLMDLSMPIMDGFTAFEKIRSDPQTAATPIVAVSSSAMRGDPESILARGFDGYISKPLNPETFESDIRRILG